MADAFITVNIEGVSDAIAALQHLKDKVRDATYSATYLAGTELKETAQRNFIGTHAPGAWHIGGSAPNTVSGDLKRSIRAWPVVSQGPARYMVQVNPTLIYSRVIELGGRISHEHAEFLSWIGQRANGSWGLIQKRTVTIRPHPYLRPATESMPPKMQVIYGNAWKRAWSV